MIALAKRVYRRIRKRLDFSDKTRIQQLMKEPPKVRSKSIVFVSSDDYSGNPKALFQYMIDHGYNKRYRMTWIFEKRENYFKFRIPNVRSVCMWAENAETEQRSYASYKAIMSAKYVFYSHNVNWVRKFSKEQIYIDLWHGCGYKGDLKSDKRRIYYDYLMVTGRKYIDIFRTVLKDPDGKILDLGYPRNELLFTSKSSAAEMIRQLKNKVRADKVIIWMPTYRKSTVARLDTDTAIGTIGLPVVYDAAEMRMLDDRCRQSGVMLIIKQHLLQQSYTISPEELSNIVFINDKTLKENGADLYELIGQTDALLTDYSSVAIDYMLLDRPIGYTLDDYDQYEEMRGWSFDNVKEYMPGHHIYTLDDLFAFINDIAAGKDLYKEKRDSVIDEVHTYRDGFSKRILDYFGI